MRLEVAVARVLVSHGCFGTLLERVELPGGSLRKLHPNKPKRTYHAACLAHKWLAHTANLRPLTALGCQCQAWTEWKAHASAVVS